MTRLRILAALALACVTLIFTTGAEARPRQRAGLHPECNVTMPCAVPSASTPYQVRVTRGRYIANQLGFGGAVVKRAAPSLGRSTAGIVAPLAAKVAEIQSACGSRVISAVRHTHIAGTRRLSLHASGQAVDMAGNPACIYSRLQGWPGGYSTDYGRMAHVHISYGGPEHGLRFAHGGGKRYARRHARYAAAR